MTSFRTIAARIDPITPPMSLRELDRRHRWHTSHPISFNAIAERHFGPSSADTRFLSYNTFLLPPISVPFDVSDMLFRVGITIEQAMQDLGLTVAEFLFHTGRDAMDVIKAKFDPISLAKALGADMGALEDVVKGVVGFVDTITFGVFDLAEHLTIDIVLGFMQKSAMDVIHEVGIGIIEILGLLGMDPLENLIALVMLTGKVVLAPFGKEIPYPYQVEGKPALHERALAIGAACAKAGYDVMAFSEVWDQEPSAREAIKSTLAQGAKAITGEVVGPQNDFALKDSGLYRLCMGQRFITEFAMIPFSEAGDKLIDTDAWATKGVLLTRINIGPGVIDLYNMHLISGADLLGKQIDQIQADEGDQSNKRLAQVNEAIEFIKQTHRPENVAIICGDTNIDAETNDFAPSLPYTDMVTAFSAIGMDDLFTTQGFFEPALADLRGCTHGPEGGGMTRFDGRCKVIADGKPNAGFCDEQEEASVAARIDYVFVERPAPEHSFELDFSRIRRAPFPHAGLPEDQGFLSDHIGHDILLIASPSTH